MARKDGNYKHVSRCSGTAKSTGEQCRNPVVSGGAKCRLHGGASPRGEESPHYRHGLYSRYENPNAVSHIEAAKNLSAVQTLEQTIPVMAGILSLWMETGIAFDSESYLATTALLGRLTRAVESYEKLTNPELRTGRLIHEHNYREMSVEDLANEISELHQEANDILSAAAADETQT